MVCGHGYIIRERANTRDDRGMDNNNNMEAAQDGMSYVGRPRFSSPTKEKRASASLDDLSDTYLQIRDAMNEDLNEKGYVLVRDITDEGDEDSTEDRKQTEMAGQHRIKWRFFHPKPEKRQQQRVPMFQHTRFGSGRVRSANTGSVEEETRQVPAAYRVLYRTRIAGGSGRRSTLPFGGIHRPRFHSSETNEKKEAAAAMKNYKIVAVLENENY